MTHIKLLSFISNHQFKHFFRFLHFDFTFNDEKSCENEIYFTSLTRTTSEYDIGVS